MAVKYIMKNIVYIMFIRTLTLWLRRYNVTRICCQVFVNSLKLGRCQAVMIFPTLALSS